MNLTQRHGRSGTTSVAAGVRRRSSSLLQAAPQDKHIAPLIGASEIGRLANPHHVAGDRTRRGPRDFARRIYAAIVSVFGG